MFAHCHHFGVILFGLLTLGMPAMWADSDVGFPERDDLDVERNITRVPLYIPGKCPPNQLFYPGDQQNDWICDCSPGFLYYAPHDACYEAFRQGPCTSGQQLILEDGAFNPICVRNVCGQDGQALYRGECYELYKDGGPCKLAAGGGTFGVNASTLQLECLQGVDRLSKLHFTTNICPPGSRRDRKNKCRPTRQ